MVALLAVLLSADQAAALDSKRALTQYFHRIWQTQQGLPQPTITALRQTQDGYLWLGTRSGLVRFDGLRFSTIADADNPDLNDAWIQDLKEDSHRSLWIATDGDGLFQMQNKHVVRFDKAQGLPSENVHCILIDRAGVVWAGTDVGLARLIGSRFVVVPVNDGLPAFDVRAICQDKAGAVWIGGAHGELYSSDGKRFHASTSKLLMAHHIVNALLGSQDGTLWIATSNGLINLNTGAADGSDGNGTEHAGTERLLGSRDGLASDVVFCLAEAPDGSLWVGTKEGFSRLRGRDVESFGTDDGLSQSTVYALCEDHEGGLWVGTKHGLNQFVDRRVIPFTMSEGLPSNRTGPILQDHAGTIWVGTLDAGLARFDGRRFVAVPGDALPSKAIYSLANSDEEGFWIGTDKGLCRIRDEKLMESATTQQGLPSNQILCLCQDAEKTLWVGTAKGLARSSNQGFEKVPANEGINDYPILTIVDCGEYLLVSIEGQGVFQCADGKLSTVPLVTDSTADVDAAYRDVDGLVWLGTRGNGLLLLDGDRTHRFTTKDGLFDDEIFGIAADDQNRLWMACSKGIFFVERDKLKEFAAGALKQLESTFFTPLDALRAIECQEGVQPSIQKTRDGHMWFSTIRGLVVVDPNYLQRQLPPPAVVIEKMVVNGADQDPDLIKSLGPGNSNVSFQYGALSYASPSRITYRYRLEGFDKDWVEAGSRREAFYTNLSPGTYSFTVAANNVDGKEYQTPHPIQFAIAPRFYQTAWFWPLCGLLAAATIWSGYRMRVRKIRDRLTTIVAERSRIARELHDTLMQGFAGVTMEMQALASHLPPSESKGTLLDIIQDAGTCLREARRSVAGLRVTRSGLADSLAQEAKQLTETHDVELELQVGDISAQLAPDTEYNLLRIAQEAITNSVKHAKASHIKVVLKEAPEALRLSIDDDGAGFHELDEVAARAGRYGLIGMRERARHVGASFQLESEIGRGTLIAVVLPLVSTEVRSVN